MAKKSGVIIRIVGRVFLWYLRRIINRSHYIIKVRGRAKDRSALFRKYNITPNQCRDMPVKIAREWAIYLHEKPTRQQLNALDKDVQDIKATLEAHERIRRNMI